MLRGLDKLFTLFHNFCTKILYFLYRLVLVLVTISFTVFQIEYGSKFGNGQCKENGPVRVHIHYGNGTKTKELLCFHTMKLKKDKHFRTLILTYENIMIRDPPHHKKIFFYSQNCCNWTFIILVCRQYRILFNISHYIF